MYPAGRKLCNANEQFFDNAGNRQFIPGISVKSPSSVISLLGDFIYWTDFGDKSEFRILKADKNNASEIHVMRSIPNSIKDLHVFSRQRQSPGGPCTNNGECAELCLALPSNQRR